MATLKFKFGLGNDMETVVKLGVSSDKPATWLACAIQIDVYNKTVRRARFRCKYYRVKILKILKIN